MNGTDRKLLAETEKWLAKIEKELPKIRVAASGGKHFENMTAYISDSRHFLQKKDFIRAFECVVWAWSIYELCVELEIFEKK